MLTILVAAVVLAAALSLMASIITHVLTLNWTRSGDAIAKNVTLTAGAELNIDETVPGSGNVVINAAIDVSAVTGLYITCDGAVVLTANDDGTPDATITLAADKPCIWYTGCGLTSPLGSVDWTTVKATKATAVDAALKIRVLLDATP